jgi:hypothetical protein
MFSGGDYEEVGRWLRNFVASHAKREDPRLEPVIEASGAREGKSYGVRLRLGDALAPAPPAPPIELAFDEVAAKRGRMDWCQALAVRARELGRGLVSASAGRRQSA